MNLARLVSVLIVGSGVSCYAILPASDAELAAVTGKQLPPNQQCCSQYSGAICTWTPPEGHTDRCEAYQNPAYCQEYGGGNDCYVKDLGPSPHDGCLGSNNPQDSCSLASGWCVRYRTGTCVQKYDYLGRQNGCPCDELSASQYGGTRMYCVDGSTPCPPPDN